MMFAVEKRNKSCPAICHNISTVDHLPSKFFAKGFLSLKNRNCLLINRREILSLHWKGC